MKIRYTALSMILLFLINQNSVFAANPKEYTVDKIKVAVNGKLVAFKADPISKNGKDLVTAEELYNALGLKFSKQEGTNILRGNSDKTAILLQFGKSEAKVNGEIKKLDTLPVLYNNQVYVPLRFIAESIGGVIDWNLKTKTVNIKTNIPVVENEDDIAKEAKTLARDINVEQKHLLDLKSELKDWNSVIFKVVKDSSDVDFAKASDFAKKFGNTERYFLDLYYQLGNWEDVYHYELTQKLNAVYQRYNSQYAYFPSLGPVGLYNDIYLTFVALLNMDALEFSKKYAADDRPSLDKLAESLGIDLQKESQYYGMTPEQYKNFRERGYLGVDVYDIARISYVWERSYEEVISDLTAIENEIISIIIEGHQFYSSYVVEKKGMHFAKINEYYTKIGLKPRELKVDPNAIYVLSPYELYLKNRYSITDDYIKMFRKYGINDILLITQCKIMGINDESVLSNIITLKNKLNTDIETVYNAWLNNFTWLDTEVYLLKMRKSS